MLGGLLDSPFFLSGLFERIYRAGGGLLVADVVTVTEQALAGLGVELVDVERAPMGLLRVTIDRPEGVRIEDCEAVSKQLSRVFEVEDVDYRRLEVTSPGTDRPLRTLADFQRFAGQRVEIRLRQAQDGQKVFVGCLQMGEPAQTQAENPQAASEPDAPPVFELELDDEVKTARGGVRRGAGQARAAQAGTVRVLRFAHEDVERAKLSPLLDFKGKNR